MDYQSQPVAGTTCPEPLNESLSDTQEIPTLNDALRRAIRLKDYAMATEETYVYPGYRN